MLSWLQFTNVFDAMLRKREKNNSTQTVFGLEIESRLYQDAILLYIAQLRKTLYRHDIRHKSPQNYYRLTYILHSKRITMCKMVLLRKKKKKMEKNSSHWSMHWNGLRWNAHLYFSLHVAIDYIPIDTSCCNQHLRADQGESNINRRRHQQRQVAGRFGAPLTRTKYTFACHCEN